MQYRGFGRALLRTSITSSHTDFGALFRAAGQTGVPVLVIWGKQDPTVPIALSDVVLRNIPQADFFPVDSAGHLPHIELAPLVNAKLLAFLRARIDGRTRRCSFSYHANPPRHRVELRGHQCCPRPATDDRSGRTNGSRDVRLHVVLDQRAARMGAGFRIRASRQPARRALPAG